MRRSGGWRRGDHVPGRVRSDRRPVDRSNEQRVGTGGGADSVSAPDRGRQGPHPWQLHPLPEDLRHQAHRWGQHEQQGPRHRHRRWYEDRRVLVPRPQRPDGSSGRELCGGPVRQRRRRLRQGAEGSDRDARRRRRQQLAGAGTDHARSGRGSGTRVASAPRQTRTSHTPWRSSAPMSAHIWSSLSAPARKVRTTRRSSRSPPSRRSPRPSADGGVDLHVPGHVRSPAKCDRG